MESETQMERATPRRLPLMHESTRTAWARTRLYVWPGSYRLVSLPHRSLDQAVQALTASITDGAPFAALLIEPDEVSLTIAEETWQHAGASMVYTAMAGPYRVLTFTPALDLTVWGYLAPAAALLADAGISIVPQCAYQKDHLLLHATDTAHAVTLLENFIASCQRPGAEPAATAANVLPEGDPDSTETVSIRLARLQDAAALSTLASHTFRETYGPHSAPHDIAAHLASAYSPEQQAAEIADPDGTVLVVEASTSQGAPVLIGYAYLLRSLVPAIITGPKPLELRRFYVDSPWHGQGVAQRLMTEVLRYATNRGACTLWLGVWEHNARAIAFYRKCGFQRVGEHIFQVGSDPQIDWLLVRPLDAPAGTQEVR